MGAGVARGGAIFNARSLAITAATFTNNQVAVDDLGGGTGGRGGRGANGGYGSVPVSGGDGAVGGGGGIPGEVAGAAIFNAGAMTIAQATFSANASQGERGGNGGAGGSGGGAGCIGSVEMEETPRAGRFVERAGGERNEMPGARAAAGGSRPDPDR